MVLKNNRCAGVIAELLENDHKDILPKLDPLFEGLKGLRYEGKISFQKNLRRVKELLSFFNGRIIEHIHIEEEALFPFLEKHVPRYTTAIKFLLAEHDDFKKNLDILKYLVRDLNRQKSDASRDKTIVKIRETGTYLIFLLRHHIEAEERSIYRMLDKELRPEELKELRRQLQPA